MKTIVRYLLAVGLLSFAWSSSNVAMAGNIDPNNKYAWGENIGWINFQSAFGGGITVTDTNVHGYAWAENVGWINLNPTAGGVTVDVNGNLSGHAWGENVGWINFAPIEGGVRIDKTTGNFTGHAWGENVGWINFSPTEGGVRTELYDDDDNDGIPNTEDVCPNEDATGLDADSDGCLDTTSGMGDLLATLVEEGVIDPLMQNSLSAKLDSAEKAASKENICAAVNKLEALKNEISAQRGKKISDEGADLTLNYADNLITQLLARMPDGDSC